jgi:hypothetical protein
MLRILCTVAIKTLAELRNHDNISIVVYPCRLLLHRRETQMKSHEPDRNEERGRVVLFRPRIPRARNDNHRRPQPLSSPVDDLSKYERDREADDHRHRMAANLLAFAVLCVIISCGIWLANTMVEMRTGLDCALTGRTNCAPIRLPPVQPR